MSKRIISLALALLMTLCLFNGIVFAENEVVNNVFLSGRTFSGRVNNGGGGGLTMVSVADDILDQNVIEATFKNLGTYAGYGSIGLDATVSVEGTSGIGFWYMTPADQTGKYDVYIQSSNFKAIDGLTGVHVELPVTNGVWKYRFVSWQEIGRDPVALTNLDLYFDKTINGETYNGDGKVYFANFAMTTITSAKDLYNGEDVKVCNIAPSANNDEYGTVSGGGQVKEGRYTSVTAKAARNYEFVNWTVDGAVVSTDKTYSFIASGDINIVANFKPDGITTPNNNRPAVSVEGYETSGLKMVDSSATDATKSLFAYLRNVTKEHILFGHQNEITNTIINANTSDQYLDVKSDVYHSVYDYPAVFGYSIGETSQVQDAWRKGGISVVEHHVGNLAGGSGYGNTTNPIDSVAQVLPGGAKHQNLINYLNTVADFANSLVDDDGNLIPVIYRPWHEHNGDWFWWCTSNATEGEFIELFRFTVEYLRDVKGVHNFIYAFSPNGHFENEEEYLYAYPGDDVVDLLGVDVYWDVPDANPGWLDLMVKDLQIAVTYANKTGKLAALTETGIRWDASNGLKLQDAEYELNWYTAMRDAIMGDPIAKQAAYMLVWRNGGTNHFWVPFRGHNTYGNHEMLDDFVKFYNSDDVVFASRMNENKASLKAETAARSPYVSIHAPVFKQSVTGQFEALIHVADFGKEVSSVTITFNGKDYAAQKSDVSGGMFYAAAIDASDIELGTRLALKATAVLADETKLTDEHDIFIQEPIDYSAGNESGFELDEGDFTEKVAAFHGNSFCPEENYNLEGYNFAAAMANVDKSVYAYAGNYCLQYGDERVHVLADSDSTTKYCVEPISQSALDAKPLDVIYELKTPEILGRYWITTARDDYTRDPLDWNVAGSNDMQTWTTIDTVTNPGNTLDADRMEVLKYDVDNTTAYKYYRLQITRAEKGFTALQFAGWNLLYKAEETEDPIDPVAVDYTIDDFESYDNTQDNRTDLERVWGRDGGDMNGLRLRDTSDKSGAWTSKAWTTDLDTGTALRVKYDTCRNYWSSFTRKLDNRDLSTANSMSLWVQPDGKGMDLQLQMVTGTGTFRVSFNNDLAKYGYDRYLVEPQFISFDIGEFKNTSTGAAVTAEDMLKVKSFTVRFAADGEGPYKNGKVAGLNALEYYVLDEIKASDEKIGVISVSAPERAQAGKAFTIEVTTGNDASNIGILSETGKYLGKRIVDVKSYESYKVWTVEISISTKGERSFSVDAMLDGQFEQSGKGFDVTVSSFLAQEGVEPELYSVKTVESAKVNEVFAVTVSSSEGISKIGLFANDKAIGKVSESFVDKNGERVWTITTKLGTKGDRNITVKAADIDGNWIEATEQFVVKIVK